MMICCYGVLSTDVPRQGGQVDRQKGRWIINNSCFQNTLQVDKEIMLDEKSSTA